MARDQRFFLLMPTAMSVGSMIGAGRFLFPARFGAASGSFGNVVAWLIAGGGMLSVAFVSQSLADRKPELDARAPSRRAPGHSLVHLMED